MDDREANDGVFHGVDADLLARAAALAASRGQTLADVLTRILSEYIDQAPSPMSEPSSTIEHIFESGSEEN